jgi:hypothetical protein
MPLAGILLAVALVGVGLCAAAAVALRVGGARPTLGRRLAGPPEVRVGRLLDGEAQVGSRTVRVAGRIRCREPLHAGGGERLVAFHRDVEVRVGGRWRTVERLRETRSFELWDHDGSLTIDPALAAEPLVAIPGVWRGDPGELEEPHASAVARLAERHGPATQARSTTRTINVTDELLVLARPVLDTDGRTRLAPPPGGYVITNLALNDAMRLLGGRHRRVAAAAVIGLGLGVVLAAVGSVGAILAALLGG